MDSLVELTSTGTSYAILLTDIIDILTVYALAFLVGVRRIGWTQTGSLLDHIIHIAVVFSWRGLSVYPVVFRVVKVADHLIAWFDYGCLWLSIINRT